MEIFLNSTSSTHIKQSICNILRLLSGKHNFNLQIFIEGGGGGGSPFFD